MTAPSLFDAIEAREEAIQRSGDHADEFWKAAAYEVLCDVARGSAGFTTDDVWDELERRYPHAQTHQRSAMGAVVRRALNEKLIRKTGDRILSRRASHRDLTIWAGT